MIRAFFVIIIFVLVSCSESKKLSNQNLAYLYSPGLNIIYPEYRICNISKDTSRVFFELNASDLLFMKQDSTGLFKSSVGFYYRLLNNYESKTPIDTGTFYFTFTANEDSVAIIPGFFDLRVPDSSDYVIEIILTDFNRRQTVGSFLTIDRTGIQSPENFMVLNAVNNSPYVINYTDRYLKIKLLNTNSDRNKIYLRYFKADYQLSPPPFSQNEIKPLSYIATETTLIDLSENSEIELNRNGIYHFQYDTLIKEGLTLFRFDEDFPKLTSAENLIESIRFLTNRQEYDKIISSNNRKQAVDEFWLSMAGNRERARVLIRNYYSRVQLANLFFTSYLEGWKSDRGLIYIIFGPPASIYRTNTSESWNYNQNYNYGPLSFTFDLISNPFSDNDYKLRRSNYYEMPWYRAVDSWRDGRVVNDSY